MEKNIQTTGLKDANGISLRTYQNAASVTAIYPGRDKVGGLNYCALGLAGEVGKLLNKLKKIYRDGYRQIYTDFEFENVECEFDPSPEFLESIKAKMGDILWYWSQLAYEFNLDPHEIAIYNISKLKDRTERDQV